jgi:hypothetical protein
MPGEAALTMELPRRHATPFKGKPARTTIDDAARRRTGALASRPRSPCHSGVRVSNIGPLDWDRLHMHMPSMLPRPLKAPGRATRPRRGLRLGRRRPLHGIPICRRGIAPSFRASRVDLRVSDFNLSEAHWQARGPSSFPQAPDRDRDRDRDEEMPVGPPLRRGGPGPKGKACPRQGHHVR